MAIGLSSDAETNGEISLRFLSQHRPEDNGEDIFIDVIAAEKARRIRQALEEPDLVQAAYQMLARQGVSLEAWQKIIQKPLLKHQVRRRKTPGSIPARARAFPTQEELLAAEEAAKARTARTIHAETEIESPLKPLVPVVISVNINPLKESPQRPRSTKPASQTPSITPSQRNHRNESTKSKLMKPPRDDLQELVDNVPGADLIRNAYRALQSQGIDPNEEVEELSQKPTFRKQKSRHKGMHQRTNNKRKIRW